MSAADRVPCERGATEERKSTIREGSVSHCAAWLDLAAIECSGGAARPSSLDEREDGEGADERGRSGAARARRDRGG